MVLSNLALSKASGCSTSAFQPLGTSWLRLPTAKAVETTSGILRPTVQPYLGDRSSGRACKASGCSTSASQPLSTSWLWLPKAKAVETTLGILRPTVLGVLRRQIIRTGICLAAWLLVHSGGRNILYLSSHTAWLWLSGRMDGLIVSDRAGRCAASSPTRVDGSGPRVAPASYLMLSSIILEAGAEK